MSKISKIAAVLPSKSSAAEEKALAKCFDAMLDAQKDIDGLLDEVGKSKPLPATTEVDLKKRLTIAKSRAAELKDMTKDRAKGLLHSNPAKMARVYKDLNEDVTQANWLEGGIGKALDAEFDKEVAKLALRIAGGLPKGVTPQHFALAVMIGTFRDKNAKEKWAKYDANVVAFEKEVDKNVANIQREQALKALVSDAAYANLKYAVRQKAIDAALGSATATAATLRPVLDALLERQRKPSKGSWASYLGLGAGGSFSLKSGGAYQGMAIHITMSKDSWTAGADGGVSVAANSVDQIYQKLLKVTDWMQVHATLEVSKDAKQYPHVYLFDGVLGNDTRWPAARALLSRDAGWDAGAQAALTAALTKLANDLKARITEAKKQDGANVV